MCVGSENYVLIIIPFSLNISEIIRDRQIKHKEKLISNFIFITCNKDEDHRRGVC